MIDAVLVEEVDPSTGRNRYGGTAETRRRQVDWRLGRPPAATATTGNERERDEDHCNPHGFSLAQAPPPADVQMVTTPILFPVSLFFFCCRPSPARQALRDLGGAGEAWRRVEDPGARAEVRQVLDHYVSYLMGRRPRLLPYLGS